MNPIAAFTLSAVLAASVAFGARSQASCGGHETPCEIEGGAYHFSSAEADGAPAVMFLHGWGGTGRGVIRNGGLVRALNERGYAVIAPQATPRWDGDEGGGWNSFASPKRRDDIAFLADVAADAELRHGVHRERILLAGFSGGGMMTWRVACDRPDDFAAYAPIAGLLWRPLPERCTGPVAMLHTHGWSDDVVPLEGRSVAGGALTQGDLFEGLKLLREALGCARDDPDSFDAPGAYLVRRWTECGAGAELGLAVHPGGHGIPPGWAAMALDWFEASASH